jgi:hypothetical protein
MIFLGKVFCFLKLQATSHSQYIGVDFLKYSKLIFKTFSYFHRVLAKYKARNAD